MTTERRRELRRLEGLGIHLALADGTRIDDVDLVSAHGLTVWIYDTGEDVFVPMSKIVDFWPAQRVAA